MGVMLSRFTHLLLNKNAPGAAPTCRAAGPASPAVVSGSGAAGAKFRAASPPLLSVSAGPGRSKVHLKSGRSESVPQRGIGKVDRPGTPSRFAHYGTHNQEAHAAMQHVAKRHASRQTTPDPVLRRPLSTGEMARQLAANGGRAPGCNTPDEVAAFVLASAAKARGQGAPRSLGKPNMNTPEGVAATILAAGRRAGVIK